MKNSFLAASVISIALLSGCTIPDTGVATKTPEATPVSTLPEVVQIVDENYKSEVPFEIIKYTPSSRHYSVQQTEGEVTLESATSIVRELYSKEAFADDGGKIGNVEVYDKSVELKKGESPPSDLMPVAEYSTRLDIIYYDGTEYPFEAAFKE